MASHKANQSTLQNKILTSGKIYEARKHLKIYILTEGGKDIGFGHITRCKSLYQAFEKNGTTPTFITNGDKAVRDLLRDKNHHIFNWPGEQQKLFSIIENADIVTIDSYLADFNFYKKVSEIIKIPVYIDDNMRLDYPKGVVVNGNIFAEELKYPKREEVAYLLGCRYLPLRREFWENIEKKTRENIGTVMITFGGNDARNMTPRVLRLLAKEYPDIAKNVVIGKAFQNIDEIKVEADDKTKLIYSPDAQGMKRVMIESDIAISLGGQTLYELAAISVPAIAVAVAGNQLNNVRGCQKAGFIEYAGWWEDRQILEGIFKSLKLLQDRDIREKMEKAGRSMVDGNGANRVVEEIFKRVPYKNYNE